jgi:hypothetical protein
LFDDNDIEDIIMMLVVKEIEEEKRNWESRAQLHDDLI